MDAPEEQGGRAVDEPRATSHEWLILKNATVVALGRNFIALGRLVGTVMVARGLGTDVFGQYSLLIALLMLAEWLLDFGTMDVFVREAAKTSAHRLQQLRALVALKFVQTPAAVAAFFAIFLLVGDHAVSLPDAAIAASSLVVFAGVMHYKTLFKADMTMEREIVAEAVSVALLLGSTWWIIVHDGGLTELLIAHLLSRVAFLGACHALAGGASAVQAVAYDGGVLRDMARASVFIGIIGFLAVFNQTVEILVLSAYDTVDDVAVFAGARRIAWLLLMILHAVGGAFYPALARQWATDRPRFQSTCMQAWTANWAIGGVGVCGIVGCADFAMHLLGPELVSGAATLMVVTVTIAVRGLSVIIGPILFITNRQRLAFSVFALSMLVKTALLVVAAQHFGNFGVAVTSLVFDLLVATPINLVIVARAVGFSFGLRAVLLTGGCGAVAVFLARELFVPGGLACGIAAAAAFCVCAVATRLIDLSALRALYRERHAA